MPAHAREVVLELGELDLQLAFGAPCVLREDVEDQLRPIDDARLQRVFERALLGRRELVVDEQHLGRRSRRTRLQLASLPLPTNVRGSGRSRCWTSSATGSTPAVRASSRSSASSSSPSDSLREHAEDEARAPAPPRALGSGWRAVTAGLCRCRLGAVTALAERLAARTLELVEHPFGERPRARRFASTCSRSSPTNYESSSPATRRSCSLPRARPGMPLVVLGGPLRHRSGAGEPSRTYRGRRRSRARRERHEGRLAVALELVSRARPRAAACRLALLLFGREELPAEHDPLPGALRRLERGARGDTRDPPRAHGSHHPRRLPRERRRAAHVPRTSGHAARPWHADSAMAHAVEGLAPLLDARAASAVVGGLRVRRGRSRSRGSSPGSPTTSSRGSRRRRSTCATRRTARRTRRRRSCARSFPRTRRSRS